MNDPEIIPYGCQTIEEDDIESVVEILRSTLITTGPAVEQFEDKLRNYLGVKYAVVCSSGTAALHLACLAAGIGPGDDVITSPLTFSASANCSIFVNARPRFVDIEIDTGCMNADALEEYLSERKNNGSARAVIPVHYSGLTCDIPGIYDIARENDLVVIEDSCHALGAQYRHDGTWYMVGACAHSDMSVFSFHPVKHITTGEGGAITTNDENIYKKLIKLRSHGMEKDHEHFKYPELAQDNTGNVNPWYYEIEEVGYNFRITDFQCALGMHQLQKLETFLEKRRKIASVYTEAFSDLDHLALQATFEDRNHAYHLFPVLIDYDAIGLTRGELMLLLRDKGIGSQVHYIPVHYLGYYRKKFGYSPGDYPNAERFYEKELSLPIFPKLTREQQEHIIEEIQRVFSS
ncbi:MAG: UDP-4-amino-4,6-dideoxy-N-acetyl-beta-L-altrosamine transaminase [Deltaproteobacteria bacterium]|nr:UDP-4-amino-4,6-dideoxy-N-acetyl-beta-L-altrosamine transaminase [Candidatus Zymogenaceae bacterium]